MKTVLLLASVMTFAGFANAKNSSRFLVTFKSQQGFAAMQTYLNQESNSGIKFQKSLVNLNSVVLKSATPQALAALANHPEIAMIEAEKFTPRPSPVNGFKAMRVVQRVSPKFMETVDLGKSEDTTTPVFVAGEKTPWGIKAVHAGEAWAGSQAGANARVLVLDTGIDAGHQDLKANFEKGMNFTQDDNGNVDETDFKDVEGHGSHCSGTIAASYNSETGFTGVAPKAHLLMGRVCSTEGCSNIAVAQGINWGISEKVDVISMSLGGAMPTSAERLAVQRADAAGVVVVAASGNDGTPKVSYPAAFPTSVAVGAIDSSIKKTSFSQWGPELDVVAPGAAVTSTVPRGTGRDSAVTLTIGGVSKTVSSAAFSGTTLIPNAISKSMVFAGLGKTTDFAGLNVAGKFALINRGEITFVEKVKNALAANAVGVILVNNTDGLIQGVASEGADINVPVVMIEKSIGLELVSAIAQGDVQASVATTPSDYATFDGTSMATPHVAGVVALIKSANKNLTPAQVRTILATTSQAFAPEINTQNEYGKGLVQADKAVEAALALAH
ncbi:MAG: S8 family serine peptidase [Bdellovibrio sp.]|nr:S8 family serine peptidase [Bdellovibrio sp.]